MNVKCLVLAFIGAVLSVTANAQLESRPLEIGDSMPDVVFSEAINHISPQAKLSDFGQDLVILVNYSTYCSSCIKHFPRLDSIQREFKGKVKFVLVSKENADKRDRVGQMLGRWKSKWGYVMPFPIMFNDIMVSKLCPYKAVSHYVWIKNGKLFGTTDASEVTAKNIGYVINNIPVKLKQKKDAMDFDKSKPFLEEQNRGYFSNALIRTVFSKEIEGREDQAESADSLHRRIALINSSIPRLFAYALRFSPNRLILEVKDPGKYIGPDYEPYCYEIITSSDFSQQALFQYMIGDLNRNLNILGRMEKRRVRCYVLRWTDPAGNGNRSIDIPDNYRRGVKFETVDEVATGANYYHQPLSMILLHLNSTQTFRWPAPPVFLDGTGYQGTMSIRFPVFDHYNVSALDSAFRTVGMKLVEEERELDMFVITEIEK